MKILFADDEESILEVVKEYFEYKAIKYLLQKTGLQQKKSLGRKK